MTIFLASKNKTFIEFLKFAKRVQNKKGYTIVKIRSDNGGEFLNESFIMIMVLSIASLHLECLNKMVLLNIKINLFIKW